MLSHFPEETQAEIWGGAFPYIIAPAVTAPPGKAVRTNGGFIVNGTWKWGTGVMHADWILASALLIDEAGPPQSLWTLFPASDATVLDTWRMDGMAGTGSNDIFVADLFVPEAHSVPAAGLRVGRGPGSRGYRAPVYSAPLLPFLAMTAAIPVLGAARSTVAAFRQRLDAHLRMGADAKQAEKPAAQIRLAKAEVMVNTAELLIRDAGRRNVALGAVQEPEQTAGRIAARAQIAYAVSLCREAAAHLSEGAGSSVHSLDQPFQRAVRDINLLATHVAFDIDMALESHGRALLGLPPNSQLN
jgi:alkylation response protein AidB-like acyl-CoA dehydrogenase